MNAKWTILLYKINVYKINFAKFTIEIDLAPDIFYVRAKIFPRPVRYILYLKPREQKIRENFKILITLSRPPTANVLYNDGLSSNFADGSYCQFASRGYDHNTTM